MNYNIPIYTPDIINYKQSAIEAINSGWISNHGKYISLATKKLQTIIGSKYVILMSNGTVATHCLFISLKYKYPNIKKIYIPNNCYVAAYNSALMEYNESEIEILDIDEKTWNMRDDEEYLKELENNSAILILHNMGGIVNVKKIKETRPDIILIEDNCEGIFGKYNNIMTSSNPDILCSSVSFYGNKIITTGEGGAFFTNDDEIYNYINKVYTQGMSNIRYIHDVHAYNYRMTNIEAAFLYDQLNDLDNILNKKQNIFDIYDNLFSELINNNKISIQKIDENNKRANWIYAIRINNIDLDFDKIFNIFFTKYIEIRPFFYPYNSHNHLKNIKVFKNSNNNNLPSILNRQIIMIPSYPTLSMIEQEHIVNVVKELIK